MNYYLASFFLIAGLLILIKPLYIKLTDLFITRLKTAGILNILLGSGILFYGISQPDWDERVWSVVFVYMGVISLLMGVWLLAFNTNAKKVTNFFIKHYFKLSLPISGIYIFIFFLLLSTDYLGPQKDIAECVSDERINVLCGYQNPEDIVITPDNKYLLMSEFGGIDPYGYSGAGYFAMTNLQTNEKVVPEILVSENTWGDPSCKRSEGKEYGPHGIDLMQREDGRFQLGVINHFPTETVEMFELKQNLDSWQLIWRGCVDVPDEYYFNDLGLKKDGGFYASHMYSRDITIDEWTVNSVFRLNSGFLVDWNLNDFQKVSNSDGSGPNGMLLDEELNLIYINYNQGDKLVIFDLSTNKKTLSYSIESPDNPHIDGDSIWLTSLEFNINDWGDCPIKTNCSLPFSIHEIDKNTLKLKNKYYFSKVNFGLPTVAVPFDGNVYLGSFHSDRIGYFSKD